MGERDQDGSGVVVVCLPDTPERRHVGDLPANVEVVLLSRGPGPLPDLGRVELLVPAGGAKDVLALGTGAMTGLRVVQTLSAGVDWLRGRVPAGVIVCNARGVYDDPMAEWVVGAILGMQRGMFEARDAQRRAEWRQFVPDELAGRRVVILGFGSIGSAVAMRLRPFGVEVTGVARVRRDGVLGLEDLDRTLPGADILVDLLPLTAETTGLLDARRLALLPPGALVVNAGRGATVEHAGARGRRARRPASGGAGRHRPRTAAPGPSAVAAAGRRDQPAHGRRFTPVACSWLRARRRSDKAVRGRRPAPQPGGSPPAGLRTGGGRAARRSSPARQAAREAGRMSRAGAQASLACTRPRRISATSSPPMTSRPSIVR